MPVSVVRLRAKCETEHAPSLQSTMSTTAENAAAVAVAPINAVVAMIRVREVERSAEFYRRLGFEIGNYVPRDEPPMHWAWLYQPNAPNWKTGANLMLTRG